MKFLLNDMQEGKRESFDSLYDPSQLELEYVDLKYRSKIAMHGYAEKGPDSLSFHGELKSDITRICGRCLKEVEESFAVPFDLYYEIKGEEVIDATDDIRETILLEHPLNYVCSPNCKGLCPNCGVNMNNEPCKCRKDAKAQPFSQLKDFKLKFKEDR